MPFGYDGIRHAPYPGEEFPVLALPELDRDPDLRLDGREVRLDPWVGWGVDEVVDRPRLAGAVPEEVEAELAPGDALLSPPG